MDFSLTEDQKMLKAMVRDFAETEIEPSQDTKAPESSGAEAGQLHRLSPLQPAQAPARRVQQLRLRASGPEHRSRQRKELRI